MDLSKTSSSSRAMSEMACGLIGPDVRTNAFSRRSANRLSAQPAQRPSMTRRHLCRRRAHRRVAILEPAGAVLLRATLRYWAPRVAPDDSAKIRMTEPHGQGPSLRRVRTGRVLAPQRRQEWRPSRARHQIALMEARFRHLLTHQYAQRAIRSASRHHG